MPDLRGAYTVLKVSYSAQSSAIAATSRDAAPFPLSLPMSEEFRIADRKFPLSQPCPQ